MTVLLDTRGVPQGDRAAAFHAAMNSATNPTRVQIAAGTQAMISAWEAGEEISFIDSWFETRRVEVARTERHLHGGLERLSVAYNHVGSCVTTNHGRQTLRNDYLRLTDTTSAYGIRWRGHCHAFASEIDYRRLGLSVDFVRSAMPAFSTSPLHDLVRRHLLRLSRVAHELTPESTTLAGAATADLVRAALLSVSPRDAHRREALAVTLRSRIEDYVRRHLGDAGLTPAQVAAEHDISLRYLYVLFADRADTPAEWLLQLRLEAARADLAARHDSVAVTARRWGVPQPLALHPSISRDVRSYPQRMGTATLRRAAVEGPPR